MSLQGRVARGLLWENLAAVVARGVSYVTLLVLARILTPVHFDLVAVALLTIESLQFFQELGFGTALIYRQSDVEAAADAAFFTLLLSNSLLYIVTFLAAPLIATFFSRPEVVPILRVLALSMVINALGRVPFVLLSKELDFRRKVMPEVVAGVIGNSVAIGLALSGYGVWSLVWGQLVDVTIRTLTVWLVSPWRPRLRYDWQVGRELFHYGKHIAGSQLLIFGITNIDDVFVARMLGNGALGIYGFAYKISNLPATNITRLVTRVTFPAFSRIQNDLDRLRAAYYRVVRYVSLLAFPVAVATVIFAADLVHTVVGDQWAPAIVPIQLLSIYGLLRSVAANMGPIFQAGGKPQWLFRIALWRLVTMAALLYPSIRWAGIAGVCALSAAVSMVDFVISAILVSRVVGGSTWDYPRLLAPIFVLALASGLAGKLAQAALLAVSIHPLFALLLGGAAMALTYVLLTWWRDSDVREQVVALWRLTAARRAQLGWR